MSYNTTCINLHLGAAIKELGEAVSQNYGNAHSPPLILSAVNNAERYLSEVRSEFTTKHQWTVQESMLSARLHTYLRKVDDSKLACVIYRHIDERRTLVAWPAFIKAILPRVRKSMASHEDVVGALVKADRAAFDSNSPDESEFSCLLWTWEALDQGITNALTYVGYSDQPA